MIINVPFYSFTGQITRTSLRLTFLVLTVVQLIKRFALIVIHHLVSLFQSRWNCSTVVPQLVLTFANLSGGRIHTHKWHMASKLDPPLSRETNILIYTIPTNRTTLSPLHLLWHDMVITSFFLRPYSDGNTRPTILTVDAEAIFDEE